MKIPFKTPITEGDITRSGITMDHVIMHLPQQNIVVNNKDGSYKHLPVEGLSIKTQQALSNLLECIKEDIRSEYEESLVSRRNQAILKKRAEEEKAP